MLLLLLACDEPAPPVPQDLTLEHRISRIRAHQEGSTDDLDEAAIRDLLLGVKGDELLAVKQGIDAGRPENLHHLLYSDVDDDGIRTEIVAHLQVAASRTRRLQVLSDIDDTLAATWIDTRYPSGTVYPGILDLYIALSPDQAPTFISARPGERTGVVEGVTLSGLQDLGVEDATLLAGDITATSLDAIAEKKHRNFVEYSILYPEYDFVFFGDSGQADAEVGRRMLASHPDRVRAVFIHDVTDPEDGKLRLPDEERAAAAGEGIHYVDTWLDAAAIARTMGLLDDDTLARLAVRSEVALAAMVFETEELRAARKGELQAARKAADRALQPEIPDDPATLAADLEARCQRDQVLRVTGTPEDMSIASMLDTALLRGVLDGAEAFPDASVLGSEAAVACAWLLVQHTHDLDLQQSALALLEAAPPAGIKPSHIALMSDRVRLRNGQPQRYGSQFTRLDGVFRPYPIAEIETVDERRAAAGMDPLATYAGQLAEGDPFDLEPVTTFPQ